MTSNKQTALRSKKSLVAAMAIAAAGLLLSTAGVKADTLDPFTLTTTASYAGPDSTGGGTGLSFAGGSDTLSFTPATISPGYQYDESSQLIVQNGQTVSTILLGTTTLTGTTTGSAVGDSMTLSLATGYAGFGPFSTTASGANFAASVSNGGAPLFVTTDSFTTQFGTITGATPGDVGWSSFLPGYAIVYGTKGVTGTSTSSASGPEQIYLAEIAGTPISTPLPSTAIGGAGLMGLLALAGLRKVIFTA